MGVIHSHYFDGHRRSVSLVIVDMPDMRVVALLSTIAVNNDTDLLYEAYALAEDVRETWGRPTIPPSKVRVACVGGDPSWTTAGALEREFTSVGGMLTHPNYAQGVNANETPEAKPYRILAVEALSEDTVWSTR